MADAPGMRASDADREALAEELREHTVAGRLTPEELEHRLDAVYSAKTGTDLQALRSDLPLSEAAAKRAYVQRKEHLKGRLVQEAGGAAIASGVCVAIWLATGASGSFWPIWVIICVLLPLLRDGWRLLGPSSDLDAVEARLQARHKRRIDREARRGQRRLPPAS